MAGAVPAPVGGTIAPGSYVLTSASYYSGTPGPSGVEAQYTILVVGNEFVITGERVAGKVSAAGAAKSMTQRFTQAGTTLNFSLVCPATAAYVNNAEYSAVGNALTIYKNSIDVEFFTKQ